MVKYDKKGRKTAPQLKDYALNFRVAAAKRRAKGIPEGEWSRKAWMLINRGKSLENKAKSANIDKAKAWKRYFRGGK